jgi:hypothetical protein
MKIKMTMHNISQKYIPLRTREYQHRTHFMILSVTNSDTAIPKCSNLYAITVICTARTLSPG